MKYLLENNHAPKNKRYTSAIVEDATNKKLYFYDVNGAWTMWYSQPSVTNNSSTPANQTLALNGKVLSITGGNSIDISSIDTVNPNQTLTLTGNTLAISGGNSVNLSGLSGGTTAAVPVIKEVTANYTVLDADDVVIATTGSVTVTLQDATTARIRPLTISNEGTTNITFKAAANQTAGGVATSLIVPDQTITFVPKSGKWRII